MLRGVVAPCYQNHKAVVLITSCHNSTRLVCTLRRTRDKLRGCNIATIKQFNLKLHNNNNDIEFSVVFHQQYRFVCDFRRKVLIAKQNFRCAGCGTKIEQGYLKRFRYCEYLGKYFCHCCHTNSTSVIPAKILHKWDFSKVCSIIKYKNVFLGGFLSYI